MKWSDFTNDGFPLCFFEFGNRVSYGSSRDNLFSFVTNVVLLFRVELVEVSNTILIAFMHG